MTAKLQLPRIQKNFVGNSPRRKEYSSRKTEGEMVQFSPQPWTAHAAAIRRTIEQHK